MHPISLVFSFYCTSPACTGENTTCAQLLEALLGAKETRMGRVKDLFVGWLLLSSRYVIIWLLCCQPDVFILFPSPI